MVWTVWKRRTYDYGYFLSTTERPIDPEGCIHFSVFCHWAISPDLPGVACDANISSSFGFALALVSSVSINNFVPAVPSKRRTGVTPAFFQSLI